MAVLTIDRIKRDMHDLKAAQPVTRSQCIERRQAINELNKAEFTRGEEQFKEIKQLLQQIVSHIMRNGGLGHD